MISALYFFLLFSATEAFVAVKIHRNTLYHLSSSCAFIRNASWSTGASIQSCIWECVNEYNCQTAVYFNDAGACSMFSELCDTNNLRPSGTERASVICYHKKHNPVSTCPASTTKVEVQATTTEMMPTTTETTAIMEIMYLPTNLYALNISKCATWDHNGITVAGNINGTPGSDLGSLNGSVGIFIDNNNSLFIADRDNHRIMKYNSNATIGVMVAGNLTAGNSSNQLNAPKGVAVDRFGFLIVADSSNYRIQNFSNGSHGTTIAMNTSTIPLGQMRDIHIDNYNNIYVTDSDYAQIIKFSFNNRTDIILSTTNGTGSNENQFFEPFGNFIDINQTWYVADSQNHRVQMWRPGMTIGVTVAGVTNSSGSNMTTLSNPVAVVVDNNGYVYIADSENGRIMKWTENYTVGGTCVIGCNNTIGKASYQLNGPRDLKFDQYGNLYVSDQGNYRVQKFMINPPSSTCVYSG